jgi:ankyrin repeat protein
MVALLVAHGCGDIDRRHVLGGWTALHYACNKGCGGVVRALLGAGADPHVVDHQGHSSLRIAIEHDRGV